SRLDRSKARVLVCPHLWFFFSSRRRHTRFSRDWSSDVCSSDLALADLDPSLPRYTAAAAYLHEHAGDLPTAARLYAEAARSASRSEERRVGKECRSRWSPDQ